jgi:predicted regulator of Ras-like GTPase activity (Roadblock/LC7/MglB family)
MIRSTLETLVLTLDDCRGAILLGSDGMPIDGMVVDSAADAEVIAAGAAGILARAARFTAESGGGGIEEVLLLGELLIFLARPVGDEYCLLVLLGPDGNFGRARLAVRQAAPKLAEELALAS